MPRFCSRCGAATDAESSFCTGCGSPIAREVTRTFAPSTAARPASAASVLTAPAPVATPTLRPEISFADLSARWLGIVFGATLVATLLNVVFGVFTLTALFGLSGSSEGASGLRDFALAGAVMWTSHLHLTLGAFGRIDANAPVFASTLLAVCIVGLGARAASRSEPPGTTHGTWLRAGIGAAIGALLITTLAIVGTTSERADWIGEATTSALSVGGVLRSFVLLFVAIVLGASSAAPRGARLRAMLPARAESVVERLRPSLFITGWQLMIWTVIGVLAWPVIWALKLRESGVPLSLAAQVWPSAPAVFASLGHFSGVSLSISGAEGLPGWAAAALAFIPGQGSYTVLSSQLPALTWLLVLVALLVLIVLAGKLSALRTATGATTFDPVSVGLSALTALIGWLLLLWLTGSLSITADVMGQEFTGKAGTPLWTVLVFALSAALTEVLAYAIGPRIVATFPRLGYVRSATPAGAAAFADRQWAQPPAPSGEPRPLGRGWLVGSAVAVLALVALIAVPVVAGAIYSRSHGPDAIAGQFLDAIVAGDASKAVELGRPNAVSAQRVLLNDEIYAEAVRPSSARVKSVTQDGDLATIETEYVLDGTTFPWTLTAELTGKKYGMLPQWQLRPVELPQIALSTLSDSIMVEKTKIKLDEPTDGMESSLVAPALPGRYTLVAGGTGKMFTAEPVDFTTVANSQELGDGVILTTVPTPAFFDEVDRQLKTQVDDCVKTGGPDGRCRLVLFGGGEPIKRVLSYPTADRSEIYYSGGRADLVVSKGKASTTSNWFGNISEETRELQRIGWYVTGTADAVTVTYEPNSLW